jgi:predicted RNA methylase
VYRRLGSSLLLSGLLALSLAGCRGKSSTEGTKAGAPAPTGKGYDLTLLLPENVSAKDYPERQSKLTIDGQDFSEPGATKKTVRVHPAGGKTAVKVEVSFWPNGYTNIIRTREVTLREGKTVEVDLTKKDPANPDQIKPIFVPSVPKVVEAMCKLAKVGKDDVVYDIGCGDGIMVITAVKKFGAKKGVGIDISQERVDESRANAKKEGVADRTEFRLGDALKLEPKDLAEATVVLLYLGEDLNVALRPFLQKALKPGSRIVSNRFKMGDWKPDVTQEVEGHDYPILLWTIKPAKK